MIRIVILGAGNVAWHLAEAFYNTEGISLVQVYNRSENALAPFSRMAATTTSIENLAEADCYIICVADDAIENLSANLPFSKKLVVHTSGSVSIDAIANKNRKGVFYPLQTFSKNKSVSFSKVPICLESSENTDYALLEKIALSIDAIAYTMDSNQRKSVHLAAVFVCNFVNHLYQIGFEITKENQIPFDILKPLIQETAAKIDNKLPYEVQTGPAKRNDKKTIAKQLEILTLQEHKDIYTLFTNAIINQYGRKEL